MRLGHDHQTMRIWIDLGGDEPLEGIVAASGEAAREFVGWLGLMSALEQIVAAHRQPSTGLLEVAGQPPALADDNSLELAPPRDPELGEGMSNV